MTIKNLSPYVHLYGAASDAIPFYERVLGAKVEVLLRFSDAKAMNHETPLELANQVMHSVLRIGAVTLSVSDGMPGAKKPESTNTFVLLELDDHEDAAKKFDALAKGGLVRVPFSDAFWGGKFGIVTDGFGTSWMFQSVQAA